MDEPKAVTMTSFRRDPIKAVQEAGGRPIAVTKRKKVEFYCLPVKLYEELRLECEKLTRWETTLIDVGDGSGDAIVELPDALIDSLGWVVGDTLDLTPHGSALIIKRVDKTDLKDST